MNADQIRKLKNSGASDADIKKIQIEEVVRKQKVSTKQAMIIAEQTIANALSPTNKDIPVPPNTIDPRTQGTMTLEDQNKNVQASEDAFKEFASKSDTNQALYDAVFSTKNENDPTKIAEAIESSEPLKKAASSFSDFIAESPLGEQQSMGSAGIERQLTPAEQSQFTLPTWAADSDANSLPPLDDPYWDLPGGDNLNPYGNEKSLRQSAYPWMTQIAPQEYFNQAGMTPSVAAQSLISANTENIAPIFQTPFADYLNRAATTFGLFNPENAALRKTQGGADFVKELQSAGGMEKYSNEDIWGQVQKILGGGYASDTDATSYLQDQYGFGSMADTAAQKRQFDLAMNLQAQNLNPLYRNTYKQMLERDWTRAQMDNPAWQGNPLAWAAYNQTGQMPRNMNFAAPTLEGSITGALPTFDNAGNVVPPDMRDVMPLGTNFNYDINQLHGWPGK